MRDTCLKNERTWSVRKKDFLDVACTVFHSLRRPNLVQGDTVLAMVIITIARIMVIISIVTITVIVTALYDKTFIKAVTVSHHTTD